MTAPATAPADRRAGRRFGFREEDEKLDAALERQAQAEADARLIEEQAKTDAEQAAIDAEKRAEAEAVLASGAVEQVMATQARIEELMSEYVTEYERGWNLRQDVNGARSTLSSLDGDPPSIPLTLALRGSIGGEHELRQLLTTFRARAMSGGEI